MSKLARRLDVRFIGALPGRYALSDRPVGSADEAKVYACRLCSISTQSAVVVAPVQAVIGETVAAHFDYFGIVHAKAARQLPNGFAMDLELTDAERGRLAAQIKWQKRRGQTQQTDKREHPRIQPADPYTVLTLADGTHLPCFIIDVSQSGAAVSAAVLPGRGTPVAIGSLVGRVVRRLDVGFAIQFTEVQDLNRLERLIAPPLAAAASTPPNDQSPAEVVSRP
jgi:PilZ domain-containing protein